MLRFENVDKSFGSRRVISNASYRLGCGVFALRGPNGVGKSTLLGVLSGALPLDAGDIWIDQVSLVTDPLAARQRLSYAPDSSSVYPFMTGQEFLEFVARAKKTSPGADVASFVHGFRIASHLGTRFSATSLGTQKKFLLTAAWIGDPRVLFMDEPGNGLDAQAREFLVDRFRRQGLCSTILFTAHDVDFVTATGAQVITMDQILSG
ncbi:MAG: ATP-binding cassette domain-containing protein [Acidiferrobacterales bacterium]